MVQVGRVKIQVYRGASKGDYDFTPWGYYNTQPADQFRERRDAPAHAGPDHVDYGAYTGGYGAFGWYTDYPVFLNIYKKF